MTDREDRPAADLTQWEAPTNVISDGVTLPGAPCTPEIINKIKAGDVPEFDIMVATFPRSGTARIIEICWILTHGCNTGSADAILAQPERTLFLELSPGSWEKSFHAPTIAKTHLDFATTRKLVERKIKVIVGLRNPKDALVSFYHFHRMNTVLGCFPGNWNQFMALYQAGKIPYGDYFDNVLSWWSERERDNIMVVKYEDLNENPIDTIKAMAKFLEQDHSDEKLEALADWTKFSNMSVQSSTNYSGEKYKHILKSDISPYMRKGTVGDWKNYFTVEDNLYIENLCKTRCSPVNLEFKFD